MTCSLCRLVSQSISSLLNGDETLSARERNKAKRKAKQLSRQNMVSGPRFVHKEFSLLLYN